MATITRTCWFGGILAGTILAHAASAQTDDLLFIHHSVGADWLDHSLDAALLAKDCVDERNDVYYGTVVTVDPGRPSSLGATPGDNTDMRHWILWFNDYLGGLQSFGCADGANRIVMFKSCYPNSNVDAGSEPGDPVGDQTMPNYQAVYRHPEGSGQTYLIDGQVYRPLEDVFADHPETLFIAVTAPPGAIEGDGVTTERAGRARGFNTWLKDEWLPAYHAANPGLNNVAVFDFFDVLAYPSNSATHPNRLHADYGGWGDGHPNGAGAAAATAAFATDPDNFLDAAWEAFSGGEPSVGAGRIDPATDLIYAGAFRLPGGSGGTSWEWGGRGLGHSPDGDPGGGADGFPGSLYGIGHDHLGYVSEISIPVPVISPTKNLADLPVATTLRVFTNARAFNPNGEGEWIMGDLAVLPPQGTQTTAKLHQSWIRHAQNEKGVQFGWSELDLTGAQGGWFLGPSNGPPHQEALGRYLGAIPEDWAAAHTDAKRLMAGRFRDGGQQSCGPPLYAWAPWEHGDPPSAGTALDFVRLLHYDDYTGSNWLAEYTHADEWVGVDWMAASDGRSAVVFVGTKGLGDDWYGFQNGARYPECMPECDGWEGRGWWADEFRARLLFYDPDDLAAVAAGILAPHEPQPYAVLDVDDVLFAPHAINDKDLVMSSAFDAENGLLYVLEPWADGDQPIAHVWRLRPQAMLALDVGDGIVWLSFRNVMAGGSNVLQWTAAITNPIWTDLHGFGATGATHAWSEPLPAGPTSRYYRLRQP